MIPVNFDLNSWLIWLIPLMIWEMVWKGFALWRAGRNNQPVWFVLMLILNTVGILPIIYLILTSKKKQPAGQR